MLPWTSTESLPVSLLDLGAGLAEGFPGWGRASLVGEGLPWLGKGFPGDSDGKESPCNAGDLGSIPEGGHGNPFQYSCLENPRTEEPGGHSHGAAKSWT